MENSSSLQQRHALRLSGYDYARGGVYFVTVCSYKRQCQFGEIVGDVMRLNEYGKIVMQCWLAIPEHFPIVRLDAFVVMPNHVHGLLIIEEPKHTSPTSTHPTRRGEACLARAENRYASLGNIIGSFKSATTKRINALIQSRTTPLWQRGYYDHIVRNEQSLQAIRTYIVNNPLQWALDKENPNYKPHRDRT